MESSKKGYVYFFKHINLNPIKIGYTLNESPMNRFNQFKTYAPFGAEIVGFIETEKAKKLESDLHKKYSDKRMEGEWFDISVDCVKKEIETHQQKSNIEEMNEAFNEYFKIKENKYLKENIFNIYFSKEPTDKKNQIVVIQKKQLCDLFNLTKEDVESVVVNENLEYKTHRFKNKVKKGYKLYVSDNDLNKFNLVNN